MLTYVLVYNVSRKNIPDIFDYNLKTNYQILIIFSKNIPDNLIIDFQVTVKNVGDVFQTQCNSRTRISSNNLTKLNRPVVEDEI